jgi:hypothetical protein
MEAQGEPGIIFPMTVTMTPTLNTALTSSRRRMSNNSGFSSSPPRAPSSIEGFCGSNAIPHFGQVPGWSWSTSGSMGQVQRVPGLEGFGSRFWGFARNFSRHPLQQDSEFFLLFSIAIFFQSQGLQSSGNHLLCMPDKRAGKIW